MEPKDRFYLPEYHFSVVFEGDIAVLCCRYPTDRVAQTEEEKRAVLDWAKSPKSFFDATY